MIRKRRLFLQLLTLFGLHGAALFGAETDSMPVFLGQGAMSGEVTETSVLVQTRLTSSTELDAQGDLPVAAGMVCFEWIAQEDFSDAQRTPFQSATDTHDFIVRAELTGLRPSTTSTMR